LITHQPAGIFHAYLSLLPKAISLAHQMALESSLVTATAIEALEFPELAQQYNVSGLAHTAVNFGAGHILGAIPEQKFLEEIRKVVGC
jgi:hypothetical protein